MENLFFWMYAFGMNQSILKILIPKANKKQVLWRDYLPKIQNIQCHLVARNSMRALASCSVVSNDSTSTRLDTLSDVTTAELLILNIDCVTPTDSIPSTKYCNDTVSAIP